MPLHNRWGGTDGTLGVIHAVWLDQSREVEDVEGEAHWEIRSTPISREHPVIIDLFQRIENADDSMPRYPIDVQFRMSKTETLILAKALHDIAARLHDA